MSRDRYTKVSNQLLERLPTLKLNGVEWDVVAVIARYTFGFHRAQHDFSLDFLSQKTGGRHKTRIRQALQSLQKIGIIRQTRPSNYSAPAQYEISRDWLQGGSESVTGSESVRGSKSATQHSKQKRSLTQVANPLPMKEMIERNNGNKGGRGKAATDLSLPYPHETKPKRLTAGQHAVYSAILAKPRENRTPHEIEILHGLQRLEQGICD